MCAIKSNSGKKEQKVENKRKHLEMTQGIVNRLASNSFMVKGWSVVLISALFVLSDAGSNQAFVFLAYIPASIFWGLDGYFLWEERKFRKLYDQVRFLDEQDIDFSMDTSRVEGAGNWITATLSKTLIPFHGVLILSIIIVMILSNNICELRP